MIDKSNEIFTLIATDLRKQFKGIKVIGEYVDIPSEFPTVTIDEISNTPIYKDSKSINDFAEVVYRVQVFTSGEGKRAQARKILGAIDDKLQPLNFSLKTMTTLPQIYNSKIYQITVTFRAVIDKDGVVYKI